MSSGSSSSPRNSSSVNMKSGDNFRARFPWCRSKETLLDDGPREVGGKTYHRVLYYCCEGARDRRRVGKLSI